MVDLPNTMVDLPNTMVDLPHTMVDLPYTMVDLSNNGFLKMCLQISVRFMIDLSVSTSSGRIANNPNG